jgi:Uncharacterised nucleotidyltransferase
VSATKLRALDALTACLCGEIPASVDWLATIALANESFTITNLAACILNSEFAAIIPHDAKTFLEEVYSRNEHRNRRLLAQIEEFVGVLSPANVHVILLKGAAILVREPKEKIAERLISDIDVLVNMTHLEETIVCLQGIGYRVVEGNSNAIGPVTMCRDTDVGMVDIHTRPRGPEELTAREELYYDIEFVHLGKVKIGLPSPTHQILHFILHDQFYGRDYWAGNLDLRHIIDLTRILSQQEVDWDFLRSIFKSRYNADVFAYQMILVNKLFALPISSDYAKRSLARFQYWRLRTQIKYPFLRGPLICLTIVLSGFHRNRDRVDHEVNSGRRIAGKLFGIGRLFGGKPLGKI